jgi:hypothetical protein
VEVLQKLPNLPGGVVEAPTCGKGWHSDGVWRRAFPENAEAELQQERRMRPLQVHQRAGGVLHRRWRW